MEDKAAFTEKIAKLLAKAEGTDNPLEAEAYTAKAIELMAKYAIDAALIESTRTVKTDVIIRRDISLTGLQYPQVKADLVHIVSQAFRCQSVLSQQWQYEGGKKVRVRRMAIIGYESDVDHVTTLIYSLLIQQANAMMNTRVPATVHGKTFRQSFAMGFNNAIADRFREINNRVRSEAKAANPGTDLVLVDRTAKVKVAVNGYFPRLKPGTVTTAQNSSGYGAGYQSGQKADLGQTRLSR